MEKEIFQYFTSLTKQKQGQLVDQLIKYLGQDAEAINIYNVKQDQLNHSGVVCPHCKGTNIIGHGLYNGSRRYNCKSCYRTFSLLTGTAVHKLHKKDLLKEYLFYMLQGYSLRRITEEMDICLKTSFDWRHKILLSLKPELTKKLSGVVEADETFFLYSEKGSKSIKNRKPRKRGGVASKQGINSDHVAVLTVFERKTGESLNTVVCKGRITKKAIQMGLGQWIDKGHSILCSDSHLSFQAFAKENNIEIKPVFIRRREYVLEKIYHIQNVNRIHGQLKEWMLKFKGVSTKYLQNYLNYFRLTQLLKEDIHSTKLAIEKVIARQNSYVQRDNIRQQY
jgi:transposase-like protein